MFNTNTEQQMELPEDLKNFKADDPFQLISPDLAVFIFVVGLVVAYILSGAQVGVQP